MASSEVSNENIPQSSKEPTGNQDAGSLQPSAQQTHQLELPHPEIHVEPPRAAPTLDLEEENETRSAMEVCFELAFPTIYFLLLSAIPMVMIVVGSVSKYQCQRDHSVPGLLISLGVITFAHTLIAMFAYLVTNGNILKSLMANSDQSLRGRRIVDAIVLALDLASLALLIAVSVKVFGSQTMDRNCNQALYDCTFAVIIASWIAAGAHTIIVIITYYRRRKQREQNETPASAVAVIGREEVFFK